MTAKERARALVHGELRACCGPVDGEHMPLCDRLTAKVEPLFEALLDVADADCDEDVVETECPSHIAIHALAAATPETLTVKT